MAVALVTGSARGIGRGIAKSFLEAGFDVMLADLPSSGDWSYELASSTELESTATELGELGQVKHGFLDVTSIESCRAIVATTIDQLGSLDVLVNNAGVVDSGPTEQFSESRWDQIFSVNTKGPFLMTQAAIGALRQSDSAAIVNVASIAGKQGAPGMAAYCGSKFAVIGLTQSFAREYAADGIRVNTLCPGMVGTAMWHDHLAANQGEERFNERMSEIIPLGRPQTTADMGQAAVFLATAPNISGVALNVAGAYTMH